MEIDLKFKACAKLNVICNGKIQGQITSGFWLDALIPWCPNSCMNETKIPWITQKIDRISFRTLQLQWVVLSEYNH